MMPVANIQSYPGSALGKKTIAFERAVESDKSVTTRPEVFSKVIKLGSAGGMKKAHASPGRFNKGGKTNRFVSSCCFLPSSIDFFNRDIGSLLVACR